MAPGVFLSFRSFLVVSAMKLQEKKSLPGVERISVSQTETGVTP